MNYVDHIIRYLSGELNTDENREFEERLSSDPVLREEFDRVSAAYHLIREGFRRKDTDAFREKLRRVMEKHTVPSTAKKPRQTPPLLLFISVAASLAVLLVVLTLTGRKENLFTRFYQPYDDPVVLALGPDPRGNAGTGIMLWQQKDYAGSIQYLENLLQEDPENRSALLFYLLSSMEIGKEDDALRLVSRQEMEYTHPVERAIAWYTGLALFRSGRYGEASRYLQPLAEHKGSYYREARRLQGRLSK